MAKPGNDPQDLQSSVREKLKRFSSELSDDERAYVETRMKQAMTSAAAPAGTRLGSAAALPGRPPVVSQSPALAS